MLPTHGGGCSLIYVPIKEGSPLFSTYPSLDQNPEASFTLRDQVCFLVRDPILVPTEVYYLAYTLSTFLEHRKEKPWMEIRPELQSQPEILYCRERERE
jgi:hypothetical protein